MAEPAPRQFGCCVATGLICRIFDRWSPYRRTGFRALREISGDLRTVGTPARLLMGKVSVLADDLMESRTRLSGQHAGASLRGLNRGVRPAQPDILQSVVRTRLTPLFGGMVA